MEYYKIRIFLDPIIIKEHYYLLVKSKGHYDVIMSSLR